MACCGCRTKKDKVVWLAAIAMMVTGVVLVMTGGLAGTPCFSKYNACKKVVLSTSACATQANQSCRYITWVALIATGAACFTIAVTALILHFCCCSEDRYIAKGEDGSEAYMPEQDLYEAYDDAILFDPPLENARSRVHSLPSGTLYDGPCTSMPRMHSSRNGQKRVDVPSGHPPGCAKSASRHYHANSTPASLSYSASAVTTPCASICRGDHVTPYSGPDHQAGLEGSERRALYTRSGSAASYTSTLTPPRRNSMSTPQSGSASGVELVQHSSQRWTGRRMSPPAHGAVWGDGAQGHQHGSSSMPRRASRDDAVYMVDVVRSGGMASPASGCRSFAAPSSTPRGSFSDELAARGLPFVAGRGAPSAEQRAPALGSMTRRGTNAATTNAAVSTPPATQPESDSDAEPEPCRTAGQSVVRVLAAGGGLVG